ncbi:aldo/keto reductase [Lactobacillus sp. DCY120]|uniref:Aldo/keto reductase n=1 Tax=Bombilactobacillus apium TaxID=2675299 RepID=A0A850R3C6_9LACO|nr:aldo/keto reductase [Bombilactobacillus apium]NVY96471.1 aldo/keto reductase [Bombilactobacillus apium]
MSTIPTVSSNTGLTLPQMGFGTYKQRGGLGVQVITQAIANGYRLIDSAFNYDNEGVVGAAIRQSSLPREQLFISSKLPGRYQEYHSALATIRESLYRAQLDYFDLYLIHWPNPRQKHYLEAWQALITAQELGLIKQIGVSNFLPEYIDKLIDQTGVQPAVNQVEIHPYCSQAAIHNYDQEHGIITQAWSPLGRAGKVFQEPVIQRIAQETQASVGQVILRWETQLGLLPIPCAKSTAHQQANLASFDFDLTTQQIDQITALDRADGWMNNQDPSVYEEF